MSYKVQMAIVIVTGIVLWSWMGTDPAPIRKNTAAHETKVDPSLSSDPSVEDAGANHGKVVQIKDPERALASSVGRREAPIANPWRPRLPEPEVFDEFFGFVDLDVDERVKTQMYIRLAERVLGEYGKPDRSVFLNIVTNALVRRPNIADFLLEKTNFQRPHEVAPYFERVLGEVGHQLSSSEKASDREKLSEIRAHIEERLGLADEIILPAENFQGEAIEVKESTAGLKFMSIHNLVSIGDQRSLDRLRELEKTLSGRVLKHEVKRGIQQLEFELGYTDRLGEPTSKPVHTAEETYFRRYVLLKNKNQFVVPYHVGPMGRVTRVEMKYNFLNTILKKKTL